MIQFKAAALTFLLGLMPTIALADPTQFISDPNSYKFANVGAANLTSGQCVQVGSRGFLNTTGSACASGGGGSGVGFFPVPSISNGLAGIGFQSPIVNTGINDHQQAGAVPIGTVIGHINVTCASYNATDAGSGNGLYSPLDSNGLGGGSINFFIVNAAHPSTAPLSVGSVVLPTSPQAGPYVTSVTAAVGSPYTVLAGDSMEFSITSVSGVASQWDTSCVPFVGV